MLTNRCHTPIKGRNEKGEVWQPSEIRWHGEQPSIASTESVLWIHTIAHVETHTMVILELPREYAFHLLPGNQRPVCCGLCFLYVDAHYLNMLTSNMVFLKSSKHISLKEPCL